MNIKCKRGEYEAVIISRACGRQPRTRTIDKDNTQDRQEDKTNMKICETEKNIGVYTCERVTKIVDLSKTYNMDSIQKNKINK